MSVNQDRKTFLYRFLESFLGLTSFGFLLFVLIISAFEPAIAAVFLILYSFMWVLRVTLIYTYMIFSYKNLFRWQDLNIFELNEKIAEKPLEARRELEKIRESYKWKIGWDERLNQDIEEIEKIQGTKFAKPNEMFHTPVFAIYNESDKVVLRSLRSIYEANYNLGKIVVFISQEARMGEEFNTKIREKISSNEWINAHDISEKELDIVYDKNHPKLEYNNKKFEEIEIVNDRLNVVFTQHPDGLVGEIMGKASNEDWGGRQVSLFIKSKGIDSQTVLLTSLDADSALSKNYFSLLSYRYCLTPERTQRGFEPIPAYVNNYFNCTLMPRLISTQTTLWQLSQNNLDKTVFFANYSVPMCVLQDVDFWERELIAEDYMFYAKCFIHYKGNFKVLSFYGVFKGDTVVGDDYMESLENQYKQLQRWTWGGVESFAYVAKRFFFMESGKQIPLWKRFRALFGEVFLNHFFWATTPIVFSLGVAMPSFFGGPEFGQTQVAQNLSSFAQYFAWVSMTFIMIYTFVTYHFVVKKSMNKDRLTITEISKLAAQAFFSPFIYGLMGIPAIDSQIRGIRGKYMGYWVTPKK